MQDRSLAWNPWYYASHRQMTSETGYRGGDFESAAPELARLAAFHLIRFVVLQAQQDGHLYDGNAVTAAAAVEYIKGSKDSQDTARMWEMLEDVGGEVWVYKDDKK